jgi:ABC-2 type transport system permease protein
LSFFGIMSSVTLVYFIVIVATGNPDMPPILANYLGYFLAAMLFLAIGLFTSTLNENQIVAAAIAFGLNLIFWVIGAYVGHDMGNTFGDFLKYVSIYENTDDFFKGIIDLTHVVYFVSAIYLCLFFSVKILESKRN